MPDALVEDRPGLRERKRLRTERELRAAALELFTERGFDQVTVDDIADHADVSRRTFYRYFESKEDVVLGNASEKREYFRLMLDEQSAEPNPLLAVRGAIFALADRYEIERDDRLAIRRLLRETPSLAARNLEHQAAWEATLREFLAQRLNEDVDGLRSRVLAADISATARAAIDWWIETGGRADLRSVVADALNVMAGGLSE